MKTKRKKNIAFRLWLTLLIVLICATTIFGIYNFSTIQIYTAEKLKLWLEDEKLYFCIIAVSIIFGIFHLIYGGSKENVFFIFKKLGPILASPLSALTYGITINSSLIIFYIVCFDQDTLKKYSGIDQTTITIVIILLVTWALAGLYGMLHDIFQKKDMAIRGEIIHHYDDHENEPEADSNNHGDIEENNGNTK